MGSQTVTPVRAPGGAFLFEDRAPADVFTFEDLNDEHLAIARTVDQFWAHDIEPHLEEIRQQKPGVALAILRKSAELGLTAISIPERFGGMEMDLASVMVVSEHLGRDAYYGSWHSAHTGIGTLPFSSSATTSKSKGIFPVWPPLTSWPPTLLPNPWPDPMRLPRAAARISVPMANLTF